MRAMKRSPLGNAQFMFQPRTPATSAIDARPSPNRDGLRSSSSPSPLSTSRTVSQLAVGPMYANAWGKYHPSVEAARSDLSIPSSADPDVDHPAERLTGHRCPPVPLFLVRLLLPPDPTHVLRFAAANERLAKGIMRGLMSTKLLGAPRLDDMDCIAVNPREPPIRQNAAKRGAFSLTGGMTDVATYTLSRGSKASLIASPSQFAPSTVTAMARPGNTLIHQARRI
jgi:hypothetical protein